MTRWPASGSEVGSPVLLRGLRLVLRPFGYLAFVVALAALSATARLLGDRHELGFFADRLARTMWRYPEVTRKGVQAAWAMWAILFWVALVVDPLATPWDEVALGAVAALALGHHFFAVRRAER
jgi:hypothetical protein